jgi:hypothetical protein
MTLIKRIAGAAALGVVLLAGLSSAPAQAGYVVTLEEVGTDVLASGIGPIDLTGLKLIPNGGSPAFILAKFGFIITGPAASTPTDNYRQIAGPGSFGSSDRPIEPGNGNGDVVGVQANAQELSVPAGYVSGTALSDNAIYDGQTFASLGVTPGTYEWMWGTGANQNFTLIIGVAVGAPVPTPEPASASLLGMALVGLLLAGTIRCTQHAA